MKIFDRVREWARMGDAEKVSWDRRAFLKGMTVTSAGLLVPGAAVFDVGRCTVEPGPVHGRIQAMEAAHSGAEMRLWFDPYSGRFFHGSLS